MSKIPFDESEMKISGYTPNFFTPPGDPGVPTYTYPVSMKEAYKAAINKESIWLPTDLETSVFTPRVVPDNIARGFVIEKNMMPEEEYGGLDMFGVDWVYVPMVGGSMEKPGDPRPFSDANDWKTSLKWPDVDSWDWDKSARDNYEFLKNGKCNMFWFLNGAGFERLISFMGFENAAMALIDEDQEDALHELFQALIDLHIHMVDIACEVYGDGIDGFTYHDDWGSQRSPFFSKGVAADFFVPVYKQFTDHIKSKGKIADLHSCGHIEDQIDAIVNAGWQSWTPMGMNNTKKLYEEYGDKLLIGVCDTPLPAGATPEEWKAHAEEFVKNYYSPEKPCCFSLYASDCLNNDYREGLYRASRMA